MGMFDDVQCRAMSCPGCGGDLGWQTKDAGQSLATVFVADVMFERNEMRMIGECASCRWIVNVTITRDLSPTVAQMVLKMAEERGTLAANTETEQT